MYVCVLCYTAVGYVDAGEVSRCYDNGTYCFLVVDTSTSRNEASEFCASRNATLPTPTDNNEFQKLLGAVNGVHSPSVWLDAHARHVDNSSNWHWINASTSGTHNNPVK